MSKLCTIHMGASETPMVKGTQVRMPDGKPIPGITSVKVEAGPKDGEWVTTITMRCMFGVGGAEAEAPKTDKPRWATDIGTVLESLNLDLNAIRHAMELQSLAAKRGGIE